MSDQTQATEATALAAAVPAAERPSAFAINIGNLLTKGNPEQSIGEAIDTLVTQRVDWENNELASANDGLYALLQHCYSLNNAMSGTGVAAKGLKKGLANYINTKGLKFTDATPLITKIVKCVFGVDRRRVNAYASALKVAIAEKKQVWSCPSFLGTTAALRKFGAATPRNLSRSKTRQPLVARCLMVMSWLPCLATH